MNQYLTFTLAGEQYAVEVGKVKEVLEYTSVTKVPRTLEFMRGVINLRGSVVPVIDLRLKFDLGETEKTIDTSIIVMEVEISGETVVLGTLADSVQEVIGMDSSQIEPAPSIGTSIKTDFIEGIGKQEDQFIMILNIDAVFSEAEISAVAEHAEPAR
jgi:purine-binding chemotaxis protein CheW